GKKFTQLLGHISTNHGYPSVTIETGVVGVVAALGMANQHDHIACPPGEQKCVSRFGSTFQQRGCRGLFCSGVATDEQQKTEYRNELLH
ncbi:MAG: hypothetical protein ACE1ZA_00670, partial [Pseudomonadales bacterium]